MQIVIDIPERTYRRIQALESNDYFEHDICGFSMQRIANGIPLPKGHGRLIDADAYIDKHEECGWLDDIAVNEFNTIAPTIIEADKTRDCNNCAYSDQGRCAGTEVCHECMWSNKFIEADKENRYE